MQMMPRTQAGKAILYMLISVVGFALMNLTVKFLDRLPATELVLFRSLVSLLLSLYFLRRRGISPWGQQKKFLIARGLCGVTALSMFFFTLQRLPLASAITLQYLSPIFTALFGMLILREKVQPWQWLFFAVSFAGIVLIKGFDPRITPLLFFLGIGSALFAGLAYVFVRRVKDTDHPLVVVFYFPLVATPVMAVVSAFNWTTPMGWEWLLLLAMGIFTQIAQLNMTKALQTAEVNEIASLKYLGILFALGFDFFLFQVEYAAMALIGIALVVGGVVLNVLLKGWQRRRQRLHSGDA
jgi:drug/metabolite transporter (DMT)-like permease